MEKIKITKIDFLFFREGVSHRYIACASITLNDMFDVTDIFIYKTDDGGFGVRYPRPSYWRGNEMNYVFRPANDAIKAELDKQILEKFHEIAG